MSNLVIPGSENVAASYYGGYRSRTFSQIFPDVNTFLDTYENSQLKRVMTKDLTLETIYYMLYAHYANSHICSSDENQFKYYLLTLIYQYGPGTSKRLQIQNRLIQMTDEEMLRGSKAIYNHAFNPNTAPTTSSLEELPTINDQNVTNYQRAYMDAAANVMGILEENFLDAFIHKFKILFIKVTAPDYPLLYETEV